MATKGIGGTGRKEQALARLVRELTEELLAEFFSKVSEKAPRRGKAPGGSNASGPGEEEPAGDVWGLPRHWNRCPLIHRHSGAGHAAVGEEKPLPVERKVKTRTPTACEPQERPDA